MSKPKDIIEFMNVIEGLKRELRHSSLSDGRVESVAEHTWAMSMLAMLIMAELDIEVDELRVYRMIAVHDLGEIYESDIPSFEIDNKEEREHLERKAVQKLLSKLSNEKLIKMIMDLWEEFEANETIEAHIAQACDKAEAIIQHNKANIESFEQGDYDINPYYKDWLFDFDPFIRELKNQIDIDTMEKIENEGDISRVSGEHRKKWEETKSL